MEKFAICYIAMYFTRVLLGKEPLVEMDVSKILCSIWEFQVFVHVTV